MMNADFFHLLSSIAEKIPVAGLILAVGFVLREPLKAWAICLLTPQNQSKEQTVARIVMLRVLTNKASKTGRRMPFKEKQGKTDNPKV